MNELPRITIITPSYNQAAFLEQTIRTVLDQKYPNLQYGIVDGGSTDGSQQIIERYRDQLDFAIIESDNGQTEAINKGLKRADGDIVGWLCSDDLLTPGALEEVGMHFAARPDDVWLAGVSQMIDIDGNFIEPNRPVGQFTLEGVLMRNDERPFNLAQPSVFWRRKLHDELGLLDESLHYCMDFEFWLRLLNAGHAPSLIDVALSAYRLHDTSKTCAMATGFLREHLIIEKHYSRSLPLAQRMKVLRRLGYNRRRLLLAEDNSRPWRAVMRRPWWLLSQQIREALVRPAAAA